MSVCTQCGHEPGVGRFCPSCGHAVDVATATGSHRRVGPRPSLLPAWLPWVLVAVFLVAFAAAGTWLLLRDGGANSSTTATDTAAARATPTAKTPGPTATEEPSEAPSEKPTGTPPGDPEEVAGGATIAVPATAPPNQDVSGNLVRYDGRNMLDGVPHTTWRMPGDGSGATMVIALGTRTTLTSVGLVNGYAKTAQAGGTGFDWYAGNRRLLVVEWIFDDGTVVSQDLAETRAVQSVEVDPVTTESVELRLVAVSPPGEGPSGRDYTAISEVSLFGTPA